MILGIKGKLIALGVTSVIAFGAGWKVNGWRHDAALLKLKEQIEEERNKTANKQYEVEKLYAENERLLEKHSEEVVREIIKYKPTGHLSSEWVRIHDCQVSFAGEATCEIDGIPGGFVTDKDGLYVVTQNYKQCQEDQEKLKALQSWIGALYE